MAQIIDPAHIQGLVVSDDEASNLVYQALIPPAPQQRLSSNLVTVAPQGITRKHRHHWEQINYIVSGSGVVVDGSGERNAIGSGMVVHFPANEMHWFENTGTEDMIILGVLGPDVKG